MIAVGFSVDLLGQTATDAIAAGFDVDVKDPVGEDLYAAGFLVKMEQAVGGDVTASGFDIHLLKGATVGGNALWRPERSRWMVLSRGLWSSLL